jgi:competence protein ComEC
MREPLIAPLVAVVCGVILARVASFSVSQLLLTIVAFTALSVTAHWRGSRNLSIACCLFALGFSGIFLAVVHRPLPPPQLDTNDLETVILSGCVVEPGFLNHEREQFTLELQPGARMRVTLYLREGEQPPDLHYGQLVEFAARTRRPRNYRNPGDFDNVSYLARQAIFWTASVPAGEHIKFLPGRCGNRFWSVIYNLRVAALQRIESLYDGSDYDIAMMQATLIGESSGLEKVWTQDFRSTGTFHALVISGGHVAVLAAFFLFLLRLCFVPRQWASVATAIAAWLYACLTGWQAPVIRSAAGLSLFALGRCFYRKGRLLNLLAATALLFLIFDPDQLYDASFQLSFVSVALIAIFIVPIIEHTSEPLFAALKDLRSDHDAAGLPPRTAQLRVELLLLLGTIRLLIPAFPTWLFRLPIRIGMYFYELILTSAVIQVGLALPMAMYFHRVSFSGLSANAIVVPLLSAAVPFGFVAILTNFALPARVAGVLLDLSRRTAAWHARHEPNWRIPDPPVWLAIAFVLALVWAGYRWRRPWLRAPGVVAALALLVLIIRSPFAPQVEPNVLELTAIDVGQGDSLLVAFPDGRLLLVDAGGIPSFGRRTKAKIDIGEDVISPYLWSRGIRRLDIVAVTHAHSDHVGGLPAILDNFRPRELWTGAIPTGPEWEPIRARAAELQIPVRPLHRGDRFPNIEVLAPWPDYTAGKMAKNNDSLVLRFTFGRHHFLLTGDAEKQVENVLAGPGIQADVLKVGHHGSKTSSMPAFLDAVHPAFGIISDGYENSYGHPAPITLEHLTERHIQPLRTDQLGQITIRSDGRHLQVTRASACPDCP